MDYTGLSYRSHNTYVEVNQLVHQNLFIEISKGFQTCACKTPLPKSKRNCSRTYGHTEVEANNYVEVNPIKTHNFNFSSYINVFNIYNSGSCLWDHPGWLMPSHINKRQERSTHHTWLLEGTDNYWMLRISITDIFLQFFPLFTFVILNWSHL